MSRTLRFALLAAALAGCGGGHEAAPVADARTAVPLDAAQRQAVVDEMRTLLGSVDGVVRGLTAWDTAAIKTAALRAGSLEAADPALERILPADWMRLAIATHTGFDSLAAAATAPGATRETALARFATVTPRCVSCHALYRLP